MALLSVEAAKGKRVDVLIRFVASFTMIALLATLYIGQGLAGIEFNLHQVVIGIIILGASVMLLLNGVLRNDNTPVDPQEAPLNFFISVPPALLGIMVGISYIFDINTIITIFSPVLDGIYLPALAILTYETFTAFFGFEV